LARLVVIDASVAIAALSADDVHHQAASRALASATDDEIVIAATTRAEILIGPSRMGGTVLDTARDFIAGCVTVPVTAKVADEAALLRARHRALSLPDAIALTIAEAIDADVVWTFDLRWRTVDSRVSIP
jgi:predicted nucleic acid-binding protein